jgi:hypothetical protein
MSREKWVLEIYRPQTGANVSISTHEFQSLASLRIAIVGRAFIVREPTHVTAADRTTLLDLRAQGFNISIA